MQVPGYFPKLVFLKTGIVKNFCHKIFTIMLLSWMFWRSFGLAKLSVNVKVLTAFVAYDTSLHGFMKKSKYGLRHLKCMGLKFC